MRLTFLHIIRKRAKGGKHQGERTQGDSMGFPEELGKGKKWF